MYSPHDAFTIPKDENCKIWRYMDITKLLFTLEKKNLFFSRADKLGDLFEGVWPAKSRKALEELFKMLLNDTNKIEEIVKKHFCYKYLQKHFAINCWHINDHESAAMWNNYLKGKDGIAIQSTFSKLKNSIKSKETVYIGKVKYIDYNTESFERFDNYFYPFLHKRKSFEYEQELRAIVSGTPGFNKDDDSVTPSFKDGAHIRVDMSELVEKLYVAPGTPIWIKDMLELVIRRYGYNFEVVQSQLDEEPLY